MIGYITKTIFFIVAFTPLWLILVTTKFIKDFDSAIAVISILVTVAPACILLLYLRSKCNTKLNVRNFPVTQKTEITQNAGFYILVYIPILLIDNFELTSVLTFVILLFTIYILYMKTNILYSNPIIILQYHVYQVTDEHDNTAILLSRLKIKTGDVQYREIAPNLNIVIDKN